MSGPVNKVSKALAMSKRLFLSRSGALGHLSPAASTSRTIVFSRHDDHKPIIEKLRYVGKSQSAGGLLSGPPVGHDLGVKVRSILPPLSVQFMG